MGSGLHLRFPGGRLDPEGAVTETTFSFGGSEEDKARAQEMKPFAIKAAKAWVREQLEANGWKVGGIGALFG